MIKPDSPEQLAIDILKRSICRVQVGAAIADTRGIISWGWNNVGSGCGIHAEAHAISRANRQRLMGAKIYVAAKRIDRRKPTLAKPCEACQALIDKWGLKVMYRDGDGRWVDS